MNAVTLLSLKDMYEYYMQQAKSEARIQSLCVTKGLCHCFMYPYSQSLISNPGKNSAPADIFV